MPSRRPSASDNAVFPAPEKPSTPTRIVSPAEGGSDASEAANSSTDVLTWR